MQMQSNNFGIVILSAFFIVGGALLIFGSWKKGRWLFESVGVDWLSRFILDRLGTEQKEEYRGCLNYLVGTMSILFGLALLLLL